MIIECVENGDVQKLVEYVNMGKISTQALIEYGKEFMINVMNNGNLNDYNKDYKVIGGTTYRYYTIEAALEDLGFNDDFISNLLNEFCKNLINNDAMYTKNGAVTMAVSTVGFLSIFGLKLGYEHKSYSNSYNGFYFGNGENKWQKFGGIDCCNFTDWVARCVGIDISARDVPNKYKYAEDDITDSSEINKYDFESEYFRNGEGGDWLQNNNHIMMIVENDGKGYYVIEDGKFGEINYYTYEMLSAEVPFPDEKNGHAAYRIINTDALYRNTASPAKEERIMIEEDGSLSDFCDYSKKQAKMQVFANPFWIIKQDNINLTNNEKIKLIEQYNKNNMNKNSYYIEIPFKSNGEIEMYLPKKNKGEEIVPNLFETIE